MTLSSSDVRHELPPDTRPRRRRDTKHLEVSRHRSAASVAGLREDWQALYEGCRSGNPYAAPEWIELWLRHFVASADVELLAIRRDGRLVGLAPCHLRRIGPARSVQLAGTGRHDALTELPAVLCPPEESRSVLRALVQHWCERHTEWDWLELPLSADQGWFEPEWLSGALAGSGVIRHKTTRPSVVLPLPSTAPELTGSLKRNVKESIRRARNRLGRSGSDWEIVVHSGAEGVRETWPVLAELHAARAHLAGPRRHPDMFSVPGRAGFLADVLPAMAERGRAEILTLNVAGEPIAAQAVLVAPEASYLAFSGVDPVWWDAGPVTLLHLTAAERAIERGARELNLSLGPDAAKLRWSELVFQHPEFVVCGPRARSRALYSAYALAAEGAGIRREAARHRAGTGPLRAANRSKPGPTSTRWNEEGA